MYSKRVMFILVIVLLTFFFIQNANAVYFGDTGGILYKVDSDGNHVWNVTVVDGTYDVYDISTDYSQNVYAGAYDGTPNAILVKYDTNGNQLWNLTFNGNKLQGIDIDSNNNVFMGVYDNQFPPNLNLLKYDSSGTLQWNKTVASFTPEAVTIDSANNVYVGGLNGADNTGNLSKYDNDGNILWSVKINDGGGAWQKVFGIDTDSSNNAYAAHSAYQGGAKTSYLFKYDSNGNYQWNVSFSAGGVANSYVTVDTSDSPYFSFFDGNFPPNVYVCKYNTNGVQQWNFSYAGGNNDGIDQIDADSSSIYGGKANYSGVASRGFAFKLDLNGNNIWNYTDDAFTDYFISAGTDRPDITAPSLSIEIPASLSNYSSTTIELNYTATDSVLLDSCWYSINDGNTNNSINGCANTTFTGTEGANNLTVYANDSSNNLNMSDMIFFNVDTTAPILSDAFPNAYSGNSGDQFVLNYTGLDSTTSIDTVWMVLQKTDEDNNLTIYFSGDGTNYNATWDSTGYEVDNYIFDVFANDSLGNERKKDNFFSIALIEPTTAITTYTNHTINATGNVTETISDQANTGIVLDLLVEDTINDTSVSFNSYDENVEDNINGFASLAFGKYFSIFVSNETNGNLSAGTQIKLYYTDAEVSAAGIDESTLRLYKFNTTTNQWDVLDPSGVDTTNNYIWGNVTSFSSFGSGGSASSAVSSTTTTSSGGGGGPTGVTSIKAGETVSLDITSDKTLETKMDKDSTIQFTYIGESHSVSVKNVDNILNTVTLEIKSTPQTITFSMGETKKIDLNSDGLFDLEIHLKNIIGTKAYLEFKGLVEPNKKQIIQQEETKITPEETYIGSNQNPKENNGRLGIYILVILLLGIIITGGIIIYHRHKNNEMNYINVRKIKRR